MYVCIRFFGYRLVQPARVVVSRHLQFYQHKSFARCVSLFCTRLSIRTHLFTLFNLFYNLHGRISIFRHTFSKSTRTNIMFHLSCFTFRSISSQTMRRWACRKLSTHGQFAIYHLVMTRTTIGTMRIDLKYFVSGRRRILAWLSLL